MAVEQHALTCSEMNCGNNPDCSNQVQGGCTQLVLAILLGRMSIQDCIPVELQRPLRPIKTVFTHCNPTSDFNFRGVIYIPV